MEVFLVYYMEAYEVNEVLGVFDNYVKAREFELECCKKYNVKDDGVGWCEIKKVEMNKIYDGFGNIGVEV